MNDGHPPSLPEARVVTPEDIARLAATRDRVLAALQQRIVGQADVIDLLLTALFAQGHGLFIGVPGLAKTLLIQTLAEAVSLDFSRIQFTPDLMPSDITGTDVLEQDPETGRRRFNFLKGPLFCNILLADEINRTPPKTQAALLQAMQERRVTAAGRTWPLEAPFSVFATQNPVEQEGTYPLPEAQLDRFMFAIRVTYPSFEEEVEVVSRTTQGSPRARAPLRQLGRRPARLAVPHHRGPRPRRPARPPPRLP
jgi:MoxR-like ATPase